MSRTRIYFFGLITLCILVSSCGDKGGTMILSFEMGVVIDGSGSHGIQTDIAVNGDQIVQMTDLSKATAEKEIDAAGMIVCPGFVDLHAHLEPIFRLNSCESHLRQGITTALGGPDGRGPLPFGEYVDSLEQKGVGMNVGFLCGHNSIRSEVMELENRAPPQQMNWNK